MQRAPSPRVPAAALRLEQARVAGGAERGVSRAAHRLIGAVCRLRSEPLRVAVPLLIACAYATPAQAGDPAVATRVVIEGARSAPAGLTQSALPARFKAVAEARVEGSILPAPVADRAGKLLVVTSTRHLLQLGQDGALEWSRTLPGFPTSSVVVTSDGTRVIATSEGLFGVDASGEERFLARSFANPRPVQLVALPDGSLALNLVHQVFKVSPRGRLLDRASFNTAVAEVVRGEGQLLIALGNTVYGWRPPAPPRKLTTLPTAVRGLTPRGRQLFALGGAGTTRTELFEIDLPTSTHHRRWELEGVHVTRYAVLPNQATLSIAAAGLLVHHDKEGSERSRSVPVPVTGTGPVVAPLVLIDASGRLAFASDGTGIGVVRPGGATTRQDELSCPSYAGLVELGPDRYALVCSSGLVRFLRGERR
ncbi:MAG: hypothetical protein KIT72_10755 [Polyangiaceae bacterium]|nr:hypothetical protein [Polyangiaceae bacterium]MCW5790892.1 hypothetical protein [Polyangiaceae bacterium]